MLLLQEGLPDAFACLLLPPSPQHLPRGFAHYQERTDAT